MKVNNHVIRKVINKTIHSEITGIRWNSALDYINDTLQSHESSLDYLPSSTISIGLSIAIAIVVGVGIVRCILKRYKKLKVTNLNTLRVTYETTKMRSSNQIPHDLSMEEVKLLHNLNELERHDHRQKGATMLQIASTTSDGDYVPMDNFGINSEGSKELVCQSVTLHSKINEALITGPGSTPKLAIIQELDH